MSRNRQALILSAAIVAVCLVTTLAALLLASSRQAPPESLALATATPLPTAPAPAASATIQPLAATATEAPASPSPAGSLPGPSPPPANTATAPAAQSPPPPTTVAAAYGPRPGHKYGIHLLLDDGRHHWLPAVWPQHLQAARRLVGERGYVVQLVRLDDLDVGRWQVFMDLCAREGLIPIIRLAGEYDHDRKWWIAPPPDPGGQGYTQVARRYRDFLAALRWPAEPRYAIVYNEPNRGDEWSNRPDPAGYARLLLDVGQALHEVGITVLGPALDLYCPHSNGQLISGHRYIDAETFLDEMAAAYPDALRAVDVWASHAYPLDPFRLDPSRQVFRIDYANGASNPRHQEPPPGLNNRGVNSYLWELWKLEQLIGPHARELPVMITETGWRHAPTQDAGARDNVHAEVSFETMSAYVDLAFNGNRGRYPELPESGWTPWNDDPRVLGVVLFALGGYPPDWGHTNWVVVDNRGQVVDYYPLTLSP